MKATEQYFPVGTVYYAVEWSFTFSVCETNLMVWPYGLNFLSYDRARCFTVKDARSKHFLRSTTPSRKVFGNEGELLPERVKPLPRG